MSTAKKQHYVPQFYLKRFSEEDGKLWVFDKSAKKSFRSNVRDVASQRHFYDIPENMAAKDADAQIVEKMLSKIEGDSSKEIERVLGTIDEEQTVDSDQKPAMALFITMQLLRTPDYRTQHIEFVEKAAKAILDRMAKIEMPGASPDEYEVKFKQEMAPLDQARLMFDPELIEKSIQILTNHIWIIGTNDTKQPLYTSDSPVARHAHRKRPFRGSYGLASEGIEIALPLSPKHILMLCEKTYHWYSAQWDCKILPLNAENVKYYNCMQLLQCHTYIYCPGKKFSFARQLCNENPEWCKPDRPRIQVH